MQRLCAICQQDLKQGVEQNGEHGVQHGAAQKRKRIEKETEKKNSAAKTTPPADPRHELVFGSCYQVYGLKYGARPVWAAWEGKGLQRFLKAHPRIPAEEIILKPPACKARRAKRVMSLGCNVSWLQLLHPHKIASFNGDFRLSQRPHITAFQPLLYVFNHTDVRLQNLLRREGKAATVG
jgi:hypothetical protein